MAQMQVRADDPLFSLEGAPPAITTTAIEPVRGMAERSIIMNGGVSPTTVIGGKQVGDPVASIIRVAVAQLSLPDDFRLRHDYNPDDDESFVSLRDSIHHTGINVEPILCEATESMVDVDGERVPMLLVRSGERRYWALKRLQLPYAQVRLIPAESQAGATLLLSLIINEMREPLPQLDKCDIVAMLIDEYKMKQHTVSSYTGYSQSYVSRLNMASKQPTIIRSYLANGSLNIDVIEGINKRFKDDVAMREMAARYIVHQGLTGGQLADMLNSIAPPEGLPPSGYLRLSAGGDVEFISPQGAVKAKPGQALRLVSDQRTPYWKRTTPMLATPLRITEHHHPVEVMGDKASPTVNVESLHITQLMEMLRHDRAKAVDVQALEEAYLSDLEAIREALGK